MASLTMKQWKVAGANHGFDGLSFEDATVPQVGENEVLVKLHAASLNYRDLVIPKDKYPFPLKFPVVGGSDGAGEVVKAGTKVSKWKPGDNVVTLFNQGHQYGSLDIAAAHTGLGGVIDGTLRQYAVFNENGLVRAPKNLSHLESCTLTCAALTAWNALFGLKPLKAGEWVLVQGTGGVSLFALQFAKAAGAVVIATTSSKEKADLVKKLGADYVLNYREDKDWGATSRDLTGGQGVDHIVEVGGEGTLEQSLKAIKFEGIISIIGFLGGAKPRSSVIECLNNICTARGLFVGSRAMMEDMVAAIEANNIRPVIDEKVFTLEQTKEAYNYMVSTF
jgi:NADPH:quinone reductase-like Zn-dependent oxidoreductase